MIKVTIFLKRDFFEEVLKKEHQVVINVWTMAHAKSVHQQEMAAVIVVSNDALKSECLLKVPNLTSMRFSRKTYIYLGSRIGRQSNLFKHHMRK